jgi:hypothetical protein
MFNRKRTEQADQGRERGRFSYANVMSTVSVFLVVAGGTAFAASLAPNSVNSKTIKDNAVKSIDLKDGKAVSTDDVIDNSLTGTDVADSSLTGTDVADNSLTGDDVNESTLAQVPDSARLAGRAPASFLSSSVYKNESAVAAGTTLGDGTEVLDASCNPGDVLLSGGPANIRSTTTLLESFPSPGSTNSWTARVNKNGQTDNFSVVVLCIDQ